MIKKTDPSRPTNCNRLNDRQRNADSNIYEWSAVNIQKGACLISLNDQPQRSIVTMVEAEVITKSRKRKCLASKPHRGFNHLHIEPLIFYARKKGRLPVFRRGYARHLVRPPSTAFLITVARARARC